MGRLGGSSPSRGSRHRATFFPSLPSRIATLFLLPRRLSFSFSVLSLLYIGHLARENTLHSIPGRRIFFFPPYVSEQHRFPLHRYRFAHLSCRPPKRDPLLRSNRLSRSTPRRSKAPPFPHVAAPSLRLCFPRGEQAPGTMGIFDQRSKHKVEQTVTKVQVRVPLHPQPKPKQQQLAVPTPNAKRAGSAASSRHASGTPRASPNPRSSSSVRFESASPVLSSADERSVARKRKAAVASSRSPASPRYAEDSDPDDDEENWADMLVAQKRQKQVHVNINRTLRHPRMWAGDDAHAKEIPIIHASELASLDRKCTPALGLDPDNVGIKLRYPGSKFPEQFVSPHPHSYFPTCRHQPRIRRTANRPRTPADTRLSTAKI